MREPLDNYLVHERVMLVMREPWESHIGHKGVILLMDTMEQCEKSRSENENITKESQGNNLVANATCRNEELETCNGNIYTGTETLNANTDGCSCSGSSSADEKFYEPPIYSLHQDVKDKAVCITDVEAMPPCITKFIVEQHSPLDLDSKEDLPFHGSVSEAMIFPCLGGIQNCSICKPVILSVKNEVEPLSDEKKCTFEEIEKAMGNEQEDGFGLGLDPSRPSCNDDTNKSNALSSSVDEVSMESLSHGKENYLGMEALHVSVDEMEGKTKVKSSFSCFLREENSDDLMHKPSEHISDISYSTIMSRVIKRSSWKNNMTVSTLMEKENSNSDSLGDGNTLNTSEALCKMGEETNISFCDEGDNDGQKGRPLILSSLPNSTTSTKPLIEDRSPSFRKEECRNEPSEAAWQIDKMEVPSKSEGDRMGTVDSHRSQADVDDVYDKWHEERQVAEVFSGPLSYSGSVPFSGLIPNSGSIPFSGSISVRSDSSTSTRSFAFPILASEWNSSPVKIPQPDQSSVRRSKRWDSWCFCWKKPSTLHD